MIIEPVPTNPRGPIRRLGRLAGLAIAPVALVVVVAGGLAGRSPGVPATPAPPAVAQGSPAADPSPSTDPSPGEAGGLTSRGPRAAAASWFPSRILGLDVLTPSAALQARDAGAIGDVLFVAGYLSVSTLPPQCADRYLGPYGASCPRSAVLAEAPRSPYEPRGTWAGLGPHLHPQFPPGVRWPWRVASTTPDAGGIPIPVVVLGRFGDRRAGPCDTPYAHQCDEAFVVEQVVWVEGASYGMTTTIDDTLRIDILEDPWQARRDAARLQLRGEVTLLSMTALLAPATMAEVDADASDALAALAAAGTPLPEAVWYVRGLDMRERTGGGLRGTVRWVIVDDATGAVLARGRS